MSERWWQSKKRPAHKELTPYLARLDAIQALEPELQRLADGELTGRAQALRQRARSGEALEVLLPECFALVRETAWRALGERPYEVQLLAGMAMHEGKLVEMQTGEGKTLAAVAPVALNALTGRGVHVLTYNDYLARRDAGWMGPVYQRLGLTAAFVEEGLTPQARQRAYGCDVTYVTVKEAGFDHLRDGLCLEKSAQVHRLFHLALVDEADSLLIDEARIPLVIAGKVDEPEIDLLRLTEVARRLEQGVDFDLDEYARNIFLTDRGVEQAEALLRCENLFATENMRLHAELRNALHAEVLLRRDVDYIVRDGRIELVDELIGRVAENRLWPDGLQAALEAKEALLLQPEGRILDSITIQLFLQKYPRLCGMTGTARPAAHELAEVYGLGVLTVPTHRPLIRIDHPDVIFGTREAKRQALLDEIGTVHATGRPILVGTVSVEESEGLAGALQQAGIACRVLNARNDAEEAEIVAEAGAPGAVTISTNMAGRGTDIRLGGSGERHRDEVVALGGLYVIGTNRHESRRIDDQLRGRAGRQGDPGASLFLISLEDDLMQRYGIERLLPAKLLQQPAADPRAGHPVVQREVARVQRIVEGQHADLRQRLLAASRVLERQRSVLQEWRQEVLEGHGESPLAEASPRWQQLLADHDEGFLRRIAGRITLILIDRFWSQHLTDMQALRDEIYLVQLDGRNPFTEFCRTAGTTFETLLERIEDGIVETFERIEITAAGVDWEREGLLGPSSTWTYLVNDNVFSSNTFLTLAVRASFGLWAVLVCWPLLLAWGIVQHWRRWRKRGRSGEEGTENRRPD
ncbi:MAG TPA: accessory Sec system translocase SecA2 [Thermoanaerobaculia bacterium]|nr:accessory Sec system translocase SecA2 [Thermoanaerobaculia bacterium]